MTAPKRFHKAFVELPPAWRQLPYLQRSIIQDLWRLSAPDCSGTMPTSGDPVQFCVRALDLGHRNERASAVRAVNQLFELGLIVSTETGVAILTASAATAAQGRAGCTSNARPAHGNASPLHVQRTASDSIPEPKPAKSFNGAEQIEENRVEEKERITTTPRAHAREPEPESVGQGACEVVTPAAPIDLERTLAARGSRKLQTFGLQFFHLGEHGPFLAELARKPADEWALAEPVVRAAIASGKQHCITPKHLVDKWHRYGAGLAPITAEEVERDRAARKPPASTRRSDPPPPPYHRVMA